MYRSSVSLVFGKGTIQQTLLKRARVLTVGRIIGKIACSSRRSVCIQENAPRCDVRKFSCASVMETSSESKSESRYTLFNCATKGQRSSREFESCTIRWNQPTALEITRFTRSASSVLLLLTFKGVPRAPSRALPSDRTINRCIRPSPLPICVLRGANSPRR